MLKPEDSVVHTVADELFEIVKKSNRVSVDEVAKQLKVSLETIQSLVDFLVEEKVLGIEYKFTTPYIYIYKEGIKVARGKEKSFTRGLVTKEQFYEKAKEKNIRHEYIEGLWRKYLQQNIISMRDEFFKKAKEKKLSEERIDELWKKYLTYL